MTEIIAGHKYVLGVCECGRRRADVNSWARHAMAESRTLVGEDKIAHQGLLNGHEWEQITADVASEDAALEQAMLLAKP